MKIKPTDIAQGGATDGQGFRYDAVSGLWVPDTFIEVPAGGTAGQALLKVSGTDFDLEWGDVAAGGGGGGGTSWSLIDSWTWSTNVAQVDFTDLDLYSSLLVLFRNVSQSPSGQRGIRFSTDNGASFYATGGNYVSLTASGAESSQDHLALHSSGSTTASAIGYIYGSNVSGTPKVVDRVNRDDAGSGIFVASTDPINAIRCFPNAGGNFTAGSIYLLGTSAAAGGGGVVAPEPAYIWRIIFPFDVGNYSGATYIGFGEVKFEDSVGTLLSTGGTPRASRQLDSNWPASEAFDGTTNASDNGWLPSTFANTNLDWIGYQLGTQWQPAQVTVFPPYNFPTSFPTKFAVQFSNDGGLNWSTVGTYTTTTPSAGVGQTIVL